MRALLDCQVHRIDKADGKVGSIDVYGAATRLCSAYGQDGTDKQVDDVAASLASGVDHGTAFVLYCRDLPERIR